jgi:ABC-type sugar transport system substrate-binding protein
MQYVPQIMKHRPAAWLGTVAAVSLALAGVARSADYDGGQPVNPKDLKGKKVVIADVPKVIGIGYFDATSKGIKAGADDLTKSGVEFEVTSDAPTEADIGKQIEFLDNAISRGVDGLMFAANDPVAILRSCAKR